MSLSPLFKAFVSDTGLNRIVSSYSLLGHIKKNARKSGKVTGTYSGQVLSDQSVCEGITLEWGRTACPNEDKHHQLETELFQKYT